MRGGARGRLGQLLLRAPVGGKVVSRLVTRGQTVAPTDVLFEVADLSQIWVQLRIFESDIARIHVGDPVELSVAGSEEVIAGSIGHIGDVIDLDSRTADVRVEVANSQGLIRPGQSLSAAIHTSGAGGEYLTVPNRALTRVDGRPTVFVATGPTSYDRRTLTCGAADQSDTIVLAGLEAGEQVVVEGVFALKSELFR